MIRARLANLSVLLAGWGLRGLRLWVGPSPSVPLVEVRQIDRQGHTSPWRPAYFPPGWMLRQFARRPKLGQLEEMSTDGWRTQFRRAEGVAEEEGTDHSR